MSTTVFTEKQIFDAAEAIGNMPVISTGFPVQNKFGALDVLTIPSMSFRMYLRTQMSMDKTNEVLKDLALDQLARQARRDNNVPQLHT